MKSITSDLIKLACVCGLGLWILFYIFSNLATAPIPGGYVATASGVGVNPSEHRAATFRMW